MNIFELVNITGNKIDAMDINIPNSLDISFNDKSDTVTGMLTAIGIYPTTRTTLHGHLHKLFSAMIVMAYQGNETIDIPTRKLSIFHDEGVSTTFLKWLDKCVKENILISHTDRAEGRLSIGDLIKRTLVSLQ